MRPKSLKVQVTCIFLFIFKPQGLGNSEVGRAASDDAFEYWCRLTRTVYCRLLALSVVGIITKLLVLPNPYQPFGILVQSLDIINTYMFKICPSVQLLKLCCQVDGTSLHGKNNLQAVEILKHTGPVVKLRIARHTGHRLSRPETPVSGMYFNDRFLRCW